VCVYFSNVCEDIVYLKHFDQLILLFAKSHTTDRCRTLSSERDRPSTASRSVHYSLHRSMLLSGRGILPRNLRTKELCYRPLRKARMASLASLWFLGIFWPREHPTARLAFHPNCVLIAALALFLILAAILTGLNDLTR
jgi:hypothetical protein